MPVTLFANVETVGAHVQHVAFRYRFSKEESKSSLEVELCKEMVPDWERADNGIESMVDSGETTELRRIEVAEDLFPNFDWDALVDPRFRKGEHCSTGANCETRLC